jgi:hypothetical protein
VLINLNLPEQKLNITKANQCPVHRKWIYIKKKVKLSRYTPWRHMGGEEV